MRIYARALFLSIAFRRPDARLQFRSFALKAATKVALCLEIPESRPLLKRSWCEYGP